MNAPNRPPNQQTGPVVLPGVNANPATSTGTSGSSGAKSDISRLLDAMLQYNASDLHLTVGRPPAVRLRGALSNLGKHVLTNDDTTKIMKSITSDKGQQELSECGGTEFGFAYKDLARFRVSILKQKGAVGLVLRMIPSKLLSFEEIGLPPVVKDVCMRPRGMVLVTGPTGSGKTTTLATMVDFINTQRSDHIITIEDPIEYYHEHKKCIVTQREIGNDVPNFADALRRALRQDPDVILVGEMRDLDTIQTAITAAETGHLVFATLHTTGAAETINRIVDAFPPDQQNQIRAQLGSTLVAVVSQTLLPTLDKKGRVAAFEIMISNDAIRHLLMKGETNKIVSHIQTGSRDGMILLDDYLFNLWTGQRIDYQNMMRICQDPQTLERKVQEYTASQKSRRR